MTLTSSPASPEGDWLPPDAAAATAALIPALADCALLLDIDGTLLELASTPDAVVVPPALPSIMEGLLARTGGALALVSGRSIIDIDRIFSPRRFPAVGGHGAEMRLDTSDAPVPSLVRPIEPALKKRFARIAELDEGILLEDKGYSLALHFRLAPQMEQAIFDAVSRIRADLPEAPIEVLPGKAVCEIKPAGFNKASGVRALMAQAPFRGRTPVFLGDDVTDETVFAVMPDLRGHAFSVGRMARGVTGHFRDPAHVRHWLSQLAAP
jgi:trehalose 6-phosphate phosphatase